MRTSLDPYGVFYVFMTTVYLPFILPKFGIDFISDKYTLVFTNLMASKVSYVMDGHKSIGQFFFVPIIGKLSFGISLCTIGDNMSMAAFGDECCVKNPQEIVDIFRDKCKEVLANPSKFGLKQ
jgi:hypothetical protein